MFTDVFAHMYIQFSSHLLQLSTPIHFSTWQCLQIHFLKIRLIVLRMCRSWYKIEMKGYLNKKRLSETEPGVSQRKF